jgi:E3 ubiquitin-protein ligase NEDD4
LIQAFDARKFKTRDQGFLGVINMTGADAVDYALGGHGILFMSFALILLNDSVST